jgi:hypothetical protein
MFKRKTKIIIEISDDLSNPYNLKHNISLKTDKNALSRLIGDMVDGNLGRALLENLSIDPEMAEYSHKLFAQLHPAPIVYSGPVIKPSQAIPNFVNQVKNLINP